MKCIALLFFVSLVVMPTTGLCREGPAAVADFQAQLQQIAERLELSDPQLAELEPILRTQFNETRALLQQHGLGESTVARPSRRELLELSSELDFVRKATEGQVAAVLSEEQMAAYRKIQSEQRARMKAQIRARAR